MDPRCPVCGERRLEHLTDGARYCSACRLLFMVDANGAPMERRASDSPPQDPKPEARSSLNHPRLTVNGVSIPRAKDEQWR